MAFDRLALPQDEEKGFGAFVARRRRNLSKLLEILPARRRGHGRMVVPLPNVVRLLAGPETIKETLETLDAAIEPRATRSQIRRAAVMRSMMAIL